MISTRPPFLWAGGELVRQPIPRKVTEAKTTLDRGPILMFPPSTELSATN